MRETQPVACRPGREHGLRRAARALGVGPVGSSQSRRVTPIASGPARSSATALSTPPLIATATRPGTAAAWNDRAERVRKGVHGELVASDGGGLDKREALERPVEPFGVGLDDPISVDGQAHQRPASVPSRVPDELHGPRLAARDKTGEPRAPRSTPPADACGPVVNLASQVGAASPFGARRLGRTAAPSVLVLVLQRNPQHAQGRAVSL